MISHINIGRVIPALAIRLYSCNRLFELRNAITFIDRNMEFFTICIPSHGSHGNFVENKRAKITRGLYIAITAINY